ncbi:MAG: 1-acyl-sn-glycerol-3-phosphate acyltransferase [Blastocatellia bacterium]|nr:1-acyl-sn-glycerol-3-phosphate acyltransferase [Blastocatellia bacterium]
MAGQTRQLRFSDAVFNRRGNLVFRAMLLVFGTALKFFFRRIETVNSEVVPEGTGVVFVLNHPNGLIDPALIFFALPRRISFLAKSTLFNVPVLSYLVKSADALPIYRRVDAGADVSKNLSTFDAARDLLRRGGSIALFPEGISHNSPKLLPAKTGAARIALGAASKHEDGRVDVKIVPVGLFYTSKTTFRSEALIHFGEPFAVKAIELEHDGEVPKDEVKELTDQIEAALRDVTLNAETEAELQTARIAERIFAADSDVIDLSQRLLFLKNYVEDAENGKPDGQTRDLNVRIALFGEKVSYFGIEPEHLSLARLTPTLVARQAFLQSWVLLLLLPVTIVGTLIHFPAYQACKILAAIYSRHGADDIASTVKVLAGVVFMPLTWLVIAGVVYHFIGWQAALISLPLSFLSGYSALYSLEEIAELSGWGKAIWLYFLSRDKFLRLFAERRALLDEIRSAAEAA